jgi:hypothetical protein
LLGTPARIWNVCPDEAGGSGRLSHGPGTGFGEVRAAGVVTAVVGRSFFMVVLSGLDGVGSNLSA